ncbi:zinc finger protein 845-like [Aphis craccivora]|uniref:Zinc finger protein 845-like n=1 Tax=Aphis craccivora TaxID=307492 RepID=A0A6G0VQJ2_APHCR|nr:zinc finger protein 845-like [Aphis craccivora]
MNILHDLNLNSIIIYEHEIIDFIGSVKDNASTGPDGIPPIFLKMCCQTIAKPLHYLFNLSLSNETFPVCWKNLLFLPYINPMINKIPIFKIVNFVKNHNYLVKS